MMAPLVKCVEKTRHKIKFQEFDSFPLQNLTNNHVFLTGDFTMKSQSPTDKALTLIGNLEEKNVIRNVMYTHHTENPTDDDCESSVSCFKYRKKVILFRFRLS